MDDLDKLAQEISDELITAFTDRPFFKHLAIQELSRIVSRRTEISEPVITFAIDGNGITLNFRLVVKKD